MSSSLQEPPEDPERLDLSMHKSWSLLCTIEKLGGYWNGQSRLISYPMLILNHLLLFSLLVGLGRRFALELGHNVFIVTENLAAIMLTICIILKSMFPLFFLKKRMNQYQRVVIDWKTLLDEEEKKILFKYSNSGYRMSIVYLIMQTSGIIFAILLPVIQSSSKSYFGGNHFRKFPLFVDYFGINENEHFNVMMIHLLAVCTLGLIAAASHDILYMMLAQNICALLKIVMNRIQKTSDIIRKAETGKISFESADGLIYANIKSAIILHNISLEKIAYVEDIYKISWLLILIQNTAGFATVLGESFAMYLNNEPFELIRSFGSFLIILIHFYLVYFPGQLVKDHSSAVLESCYNCDWYKLSKESKILLRIIMFRSRKDCVLTGGKMFILCMETYANMLKVGLSYSILFASLAGRKSK